MKKRLLSILLMCCMVLTLLPTAAFAEDSTETPPVCSCETACTADNMNTECPVCGAENAIPQNCGQYIPVEDRTGENGSTERADDPNGPIELSAADQVQAMINGLPNAEEITEDNAEEVKAQLEAIDEAKEKLSDEEINELDMTRYAEAAAALGALAAPMLLANDSPDEQFSLTPGGRYYFDLSAMNIPGTANGDLPDSTLHYVPFTYAGTVDAYKLTSEMETTEEYAQQKKYPHSLFIADYVVTNDVSWDTLNTANLIFGKNYANGGVGYTLRAPSVGSRYTGSGDSIRGTPLSNEWDKILDKDSGYIKNWSEMSSWGQDTKPDNSFPIRAFRGYRSARFWNLSNAAYSSPSLGFRPVLEVLNPDTLGPDGMKVVTLDLGGGKLGGSSDAIHIIVKNGSTFTAPASDGLNRPDGDTGRYLMWLGSDGKLYAPGDNVPADVTALTVQWTAPTYTVTLHANGGSVSPDSVTTGADGKLASLPTPTRSSYSFNGWYTEKNGGTKVTTDTVFSANTTVYAHWTYTGGGYYYPPVTYYTLRFETGGGSDISSVQGTYNAYIDLTQYVPTWRGHTFTGWYSERSLKNKVSGVYLAKDMTVYAGWRVTTVPQTGDSSVLGLWGFSLCTSLAGCLALTTWQIRRRREEQSLQSIEK